MTDLISREAAVKALGERPLLPDTWTDEYELGRESQFEEDYKAIMNVPRSDDLLLEELIKMEERRNYWEEMALSYERTIYKLQKAISEKRHGKWMPRIATGNIALIECSECQFHYPEVLGAFSFYYCPHCGAKMERSEDGRPN